VGSAALEVSRRQCSTAFRPALALIAAAIGNRPFPPILTTAAVRHIGERKCAGSNSSAPTPIGWCACSHGAFREGQPTLKILLNKGLKSAVAPDAIRGFQYSRLSEPALLSAGYYLRSAGQGWNSEATHPRKGKTLKSPPIGGFSEFSRRALFVFVNSSAGRISAFDRRFPSWICEINNVPVAWNAFFFEVNAVTTTLTNHAPLLRHTGKFYHDRPLHIGRTYIREQNELG